MIALILRIKSLNVAADIFETLCSEMFQDVLKVLFFSTKLKSLSSPGFLSFFFFLTFCFDGKHFPEALTLACSGKSSVYCIVSFLFLVKHTNLNSEMLPRSLAFLEVGQKRLSGLSGCLLCHLSPLDVFVCVLYSLCHPSVSKKVK